MKNLYKITKGQIISRWVFGLIGWVVSLSETDYSGFATFLAVSIPMVLVFYTIGWRSTNKRNETESVKKAFKINDLTLYLKKSSKPFIILMLVAGVIFGVNSFLETKKERTRIEKLTQDYSQAITRIDSLRAEYATCLQPTFEKNYKEEERTCKLYKNKIKADYDFCVEYTSVSPRASCLYDYDYEKIDCSEESLKKKATLTTLLGDKPSSCYTISNELNKINSIIEEYEKLEKKD